jgi:hypothetical protein
MRFLKPPLTYANVMATLAVFLALGGGAFAITSTAKKTAKKNSVVSKSVKNDSLRGIDVRDGTLTGDDIDEATLDSGAVSGDALADGSVGSSKITDGGLTAADVAPGVFLSADRLIAGRDLEIAAGQTDVTVLAVPDAGTLRVDCGAGGELLTIEWVNTSGNNTRVVASGHAEAPPGTFVNGSSVANNALVTLVTTTAFASANSGIQGELVTTSVLNDDVTRVSFGALTRSAGAAECAAFAEATTTAGVSG